MENGMRNHANNYVGRKTVSDSMYNLIIGATLSWGFLLNLVIIKSGFAESLIIFSGVKIFMIGCFLLAIVGSAVNNKSNQPIISFIGYNLVVVAFGLILEIILMGYNSGIVFEAMAITGTVTLAMMALGTLFPAFFARIGRTLFICLFVTIIIELVTTFIIGKDYAIIDMVVIFIFCGYIGYDWGRAMSFQKTVDNAIDSASAIYMDIINIFVRILSLLNRD